METEEHVTEILEAPFLRGEMTFTDHIVICSCGEVMRSLPGWYQTRQGAEGRATRHVALATGQMDMTSTIRRDRKLRDFMRKVEEAEAHRNTAEQKGTPRRPLLSYGKGRSNV